MLQPRVAPPNREVLRKGSIAIVHETHFLGNNGDRSVPRLTESL